MTKTTETVRRTANISFADASKGLAAKFPNHTVLSLVQEDGKWVAEIQPTAGFGTGAEGGFDGGDEQPGDEPKAPLSPEDEAIEDELDSELGDGLGDDDGDEGGSVEGKLDEVLDLLHEMIHGPGEGAPHDEAGPTGAPMPGPGGPPSDLPAPVKPQNSLGVGGPQHAFAHLASRQNYVVEAEAPGQSLKSAVAELNIAAFPTHRVVKIQRRGSKIIAGIAKIQNGA